MSNLKMYIAVLDEFPDYMTPTLVAHAVLGAHIKFSYNDLVEYREWLDNSFKKCVVRLNQKEFNHVNALPNIHVAWENNTIGGKNACIVVCPREEIPNVLKYAKLWKPKESV